MQIKLQRFQVDYYPYHLAKGDRKHWAQYREASIPHMLWLNQSLNGFRSKFLDLLERNKIQHAPLSRANKPPPQSGDSPPSTTEQPKKTPQQSPNPNQVKSFVMQQFAKLMTTCVILRIEDFILYKVTTSGKKQALKEFISGKLTTILFSSSSCSGIVHNYPIHFVSSAQHRKKQTGIRSY